MNREKFDEAVEIVHATLNEINQSKIGLYENTRELTRRFKELRKRNIYNPFSI